ncbi:polysaccharide deacetylase family protein [Arcticibacterium luteifluviistationis]|nr:polysaccharide deacetylase family protein [Arcticibacterium luteifluviistationis]
MTFKLSLLFLLAVLSSACQSPKSSDSEVIEKSITQEKPVMSFTFDDGITADLAGYQFEDWNEMILSQLDSNQLKATFFIRGDNKLNKKGQFLLQSWNDRGHKLANHTFTHPYYNSDKNTAKVFAEELSKTDTIISKFDNKINLFRFPYLKEGQNEAKVDSLRQILSENNYANGYVTIDASDWYINQRLIARLKEVGQNQEEIQKFRDYYLDHILDRAKYYEKLSYEINGRHINHTLLLHHNLTSALFLGDLIQRFKTEGWDIIDAEKAYQDKVFKQIPEPKYAGESLIWSLAKESGNYKDSLRYPAEDSRYEKPAMDKLGL